MREFHCLQAHQEAREPEDLRYSRQPQPRPPCPSLSFKLMRSKIKILGKMTRPSQKSKSQVIQLLLYLSVPDLIKRLETRNGSSSRKEGTKAIFKFQSHLMLRNQVSNYWQALYTRRQRLQKKIKRVQKKGKPQTGKLVSIQTQFYLGFSSPQIRKPWGQEGTAMAYCISCVVSIILIHFLISLVSERNAINRIYLYLSKMTG